MNNSNSSPVNDWLILLGVILIIFFLVYVLARLVMKIYRLLNRRKAGVNALDLSNVVMLNSKRRKAQGS